MTDRRFLAEQCKLATLEAVTALGGRATRAEIRERALRDGGFTAKQLAVPGPPKKPQYPRMVDYYLSWSLTWLKKGGLLHSEGRSVWALANAAPAAAPAAPAAPPAVARAVAPAEPAERTEPALGAAAAPALLVIDVAARHAELTQERGRGRWSWFRRSAA